MVLFIGTSFCKSEVNLVNVSVVDTVYTSKAVFTSLSNSNLTTSFLDCGNTAYELYRLDLYSLSSVVLDTCHRSSFDGTCLESGDTTSPTSEAVSINTSFSLGFSSASLSRNKSELTTGVKFDGDVKVERLCVLKDDRRK